MISSVIALFVFIKIIEYYKKNKEIRLAELNWLYSSERYENAIAYMSKSLIYNPNSYFLNNETAFCLINLGRASEAIKYLEKALENIPDGGYSALSNMAWAAYETGDYYKCLYYSDLALTKNPKAKLALVSKGNALLRMNKFEEANNCFEYVLKEDENYDPALLSKAMYHNRLEEYDSAVVYFQKYCQLKPRKLSALNELANALFRAKRFEEVIKVFDRIISIDDRQLRAYCDKAHVLGCMGKFDEAMKNLNEVISINPDYALAYYFQARIYSHLRFKEEAFKHLELAIELQPEFKKMAEDDINLNNLKFFNQFYDLIK